MGAIKLRVGGGLDIAIPGAPRQVVREGVKVMSVALQGADYPGVRSLLHVEVGDRVSTGQTLFVDRKRPQIRFVSPGTGVVTSIEFGHRRILDVLTIDLDGDDAVAFEVPENFTRKNVQALLLESGMWPAFRTRPFGRIPDPHSVPDAIFVTAMDTNPLAADAHFIIEHHTKHFRAGLELLGWLTDGTVFVCQAPGEALVDADEARMKSVHFAGRHPAGLPGTHIHRLSPVSANQTVWHIGYQDVIALGALRTTGAYWSERIVALTGPCVQNPALVLTRLGACLADLLAGELRTGDTQVISGPLLSGRKAAFLGHYHTQVLVLPEAQALRRPGWLARILGTANQSKPVPLIATGALESAMALDILPVPLLRALSVGDTEAAERLGCLELVEEDIALLSYACASGVNYGMLLRDVLNELEARG